MLANEVQDVLTKMKNSLKSLDTQIDIALKCLEELIEADKKGDTKTVNEKKQDVSKLLVSIILSRTFFQSIDFSVFNS